MLKKQNFALNRNSKAMYLIEETMETIKKKKKTSNSERSFESVYGNSYEYN